jgi:hypothetical protein
MMNDVRMLVPLKKYRTTATGAVAAQHPRDRARHRVDVPASPSRGAGPSSVSAVQRGQRAV